LLVRSNLVEPQKQNHQHRYRRRQREAPMKLWHLDIRGGVFLADGREAKSSVIAWEAEVFEVQRLTTGRSSDTA
jgi:hypothetical protein